VANALVIINIECENGMDNHKDNCVVNIVRSSLEVALLGEHIPFSGNPLIYIMSLCKINQEMGEKGLVRYQSLKPS
jgi:hypothetical protein